MPGQHNPAAGAILPLLTFASRCSLGKSILSHPHTHHLHVRPHSWPELFSAFCTAVLPMGKTPPLPPPPLWSRARCCQQPWVWEGHPNNMTHTEPNWEYGQWSVLPLFLPTSPRGKSKLAGAQGLGMEEGREESSAQRWSKRYQRCNGGRQDERRRTGEEGSRMGAAGKGFGGSFGFLPHGTGMRFPPGLLAPGSIPVPTWLWPCTVPLCCSSTRSILISMLGTLLLTPGRGQCLGCFCHRKQGKLLNPSPIPGRRLSRERK